MSGPWLPIERAPMGADMLLYSRHFPMCVGRFRCGRYGEPFQNLVAWRSADSGSLIDDPTHWMPLPEPPND